MTTPAPALQPDPAVTCAGEARRWREFADRLSALRETLAAEFAQRTAGQGLLPIASYARADGTSFLLVVPPGAEHPALLSGAAGDCVLDFGTHDEPGTERLIGDVFVPPAGDRVFYTIDVDGSDRYLVRARRLAAPDAPRTLARGAGPALAWDARSGRVLITVLDEALRPSAACAIDPGSCASAQVCTASSGEEYLNLRTSSDGRRALISAETHSSCRVALLGDGLRPVPLWPAGGDDRMQADCWAGRAAMIRSSAGQADRLYAASLPSGSGGPARWDCVYTAAPGACLEDVACGAGHALVVERAAGGQSLVRVSLDGGAATRVPFTAPGTAPDEPSSIEILPGTRPPGAVSVLRGSWHSPSCWFLVDPAGGTARLAAPGVQGTMRADTGRADTGMADTGRADTGMADTGMADTGRADTGLADTGMDVVRLSVPSAGGVQVPLTLMRPSGQPGPLPTVLYAYGAYGVPLDPACTPFRQSLLDRGVAFAIAHVRGGGDLGAAWHEAGRRLNKPSAVADYLAAARYLTGHGWAPPGRLVARGQSAGAAIVGAAVNQAPGLFAVTVLETPFLDCLRTLLDEDAPLTSTGWDEWGDPRTDPAARAMLAALSPLDNIPPGPYPALLLTAGEQDTRISAAEPLRFAAAVRAAEPGGDVLVRVSDVGHLGHSATTADHQDEADVLAFILDRLGLAAQASRPARDPGGSR